MPIGGTQTIPDEAVVGQNETLQPTFVVVPGVNFPVLPDDMFQQFIRSIPPSQRSVYFTTNIKKNPNEANKQIEVRINPRQVSCKQYTDLLNRVDTIEPHLKGDVNKQGTNLYFYLQKLVKEIQTQYVVANNTECAFAAWLTTQITFEPFHDVTYNDYKDGKVQAVQHNIPFPYVPSTQRALYFTFKYFTSHRLEQTKGTAYFSKVYTDLMAGNYKPYVPPSLYKTVWSAPLLEPGAAHQMAQMHAKQTREPLPQATKFLYELSVTVDFASLETTGAAFERVSLKKPADDLDGFNVFVQLYALNAAKQDQKTIDTANLIINDKYSAHDIPNLKDHTQLNVLMAAEAVRRTRVNIQSAIQGELNDMITAIELAESQDPVAKTRTVQETNLIALLKRFRNALKVRDEFVKQGPKFEFKNKYDLDNLPATQQIFAKMAKDCYVEFDSRQHIFDPVKAGVYYFIKGCSTVNISVYYATSNVSLQSPCVIFAYRGTSEAETLKKFENRPSGFFNTVMHGLLAVKDVLTNPASDIITDLHILFGNQASTQRMDVTQKYFVQQLKSFPGVKAVYFTGHSLGGSIAMNQLERNGTLDIVKQAVVFNPGVGLDSTYFSEYTRKRKRDEPKYVLCDKLTTHRNGGPTPSWTTDDLVSVFSGAFGQTYYYVGPGIKGFPDCHKSYWYNTEDVYDTPTLPTIPPVLCSFSAIERKTDAAS